MNASNALPSRAKVFGRGLTRRCARCGSGGLFQHWTKMKPDCPRCGLHFEREPGYFAGALAINVICTGGLLLLAFAIVLAFTLPDVNVVVTLAVLAPIALLGPIVWYPFSKTLWVAVDRAILQRLDPYERPDD
jgi:uncharacterized protein (DUF983 family)